MILNTIQKLLGIFSTAFALNLIWEHLHSYLYAHYMDGKITELVLFRATLVDAIMITAIAVPFLYLPFLKNKNWLIVPIGIVIAVLIEWYALGAGRWVYNLWMPIIPLLATGLTPTIQLGLLGYVVMRLVDRS